jgi:hypothetical protein
MNLAIPTSCFPNECDWLSASCVHLQVKYIQPLVSSDDIVVLLALHALTQIQICVQSSLFHLQHILPLLPPENRIDSETWK